MVKPRRKTELTLWGEPFEEHQKLAGPELLLCEWMSHTVRVVMIKGEPWWVLVDVARVLGYGSAKDAGRILRDKHKGRHLVPTLGGDQEMLVINEPGLYRLMMRSDQPEAERFQDWITDEVIPSIRKTGTYRSKAGRVARVIRKTKTDDATVLVPRIEQLEFNRKTNRQLADQGAGRRGIADYHNGVYVGQFGRKAAELRRVLALKSHQTPLDRMAGFSLIQNLHIKMMIGKLVQEKAREKGEPLSDEERAGIIEDTTKGIVEADFNRLGYGFQYGLAEDEKRGYVLDVIRVQMSAN